MRRPAPVFGITSLFVIALLTACGAGTPEGARGATPVKYVICSASDTQCFVSARFGERWVCEQYRKLEEANCAFRDEVNTVECVALDRPKMAVSYCI